MNISKLYETKDGGDLTFQDCKKINVALSEILLSEIPDEQKENVKDYLINALNMNAVEAELKDSLSSLLNDLQ